MKKAISAAEAKSISNPGSHYAGETLYLYVAPGGSKSWVQRLTIHGRRCDIGLGGFPVVSLSEARDKAYQNRKLARAGGDPLAEKRKAKVPTFREAAEKTFEANRARWRSEKTVKAWNQGMKKHVLPQLGPLRVDRVTREHVLRILTPMWTKKTGGSPQTAQPDPHGTVLVPSARFHRAQRRRRDDRRRAAGHAHHQ